MFLLVLTSLLSLSSAVGEEVAIKPPTGFSKRFAYFSGTAGTSSYKLDWDTFYARMDQVADSKRYKYIYVKWEDNETESEEMLVYGLQNNEVDGKKYHRREDPVFAYVSKKEILMLMFSNSESLFTYDRYEDYLSAIGEWNDQLAILE